MEGGEEGKIRGGICINKSLEGGAIKFFQENEGWVAIKFEGNLLNKHGIHLVANVTTKSWSLM